MFNQTVFRVIVIRKFATHRISIWKCPTPTIYFQVIPGRCRHATYIFFTADLLSSFSILGLPLRGPMEGLSAWIMFLRASIASDKRSSRQLSSPDSRCQTTCWWFGCPALRVTETFTRKGKPRPPVRSPYGLRSVLKHFWRTNSDTLCNNAYSKTALDFVAARTTLLMPTYMADALFTLY